MKMIESGRGSGKEIAKMMYQNKAVVHLYGLQDPITYPPF